MSKEKSLQLLLQTEKNTQRSLMKLETRLLNFVEIYQGLNCLLDRKFLDGTLGVMK